MNKSTVNMASVKIVLRTNYKRNDATYALALQIIKDRLPTYKNTGHYILQKDWDSKEQRIKKSHPNSARLNNALLKKRLDAESLILDLEAADDGISARQVRTRIQKPRNEITFFELAAERIKNKRLRGTFSVANAEQSILNNIEKFTNNDRLQFQDITPAFLEKFKAFCVHELEQKTRTVTNQLIFIRTLFNTAIKDGIVDRKYYPFAGEKEKIKLTSGHKIGLTKEEIEAIENLELEKSSNIWHTRNIWLFAFYFAGTRISDVLKLTWKDFKDGRLFYVMNKNEKPLSLIVPDKAKVILENYRKREVKNSDYVFPFLKKADQRSKRDIFVKSRNATSLFNKHLKRIARICDIDKNLSNHIARHSFGNIAGDNIHPLMLQKLYRHSDLKTTLNYQANFIHKEADDALESVVNF